MTKANELFKAGQSLWLDNIKRGLIEEGGLQALIEDGIVGVTSNPSIFEKAITESGDYNEQIRALDAEGKSAPEIYEALVLEDIKNAADVLYPVFEETNGRDGYVSLEVNPNLAYDTEGTIAEARRLFGELGRPNVMIKVPATPAGVPAIAALIGEGININVTLLFDNDNYTNVAQAYISGLERWASTGGDLRQVASVASFFVSRVDTIVNKALEAINNEELQGKIAIANAKIAYTLYEDIFSGEQWEALANQGARPQRLLWASTSTKNPDYPDTMYVDGLIGPNTVNTVPPATLEAFQEHGTVEVTLTVDVDDARERVARLQALGIDLGELTDKLQADGVKAFAKSFNSLMDSIVTIRRRMRAGQLQATVRLGQYESVYQEHMAELEEENVIQRIWEQDYKVWKPEPKEIVNRLGWLDIAESMEQYIDRLQALVEEARSAGYTRAVLLGMGGSSLAPEVFSKTIGAAEGYLDLTVLDSTDPGAVLAVEQALDFAKTLFIVATKSGGTAETLSFFKYFYNRVSDAFGEEDAGEHFVAITDPGSKLVAIAEKYGFRTTFLNDPNIGGRYSALSYFGLVAAALLGVNIRRLLDRAQIAACNAGGEGCEPQGENIAAQLGAAMSALALAGRDKLTLITSPPLTSFGDWVEQLIAESTGKEGKGILPVVGEAVGKPNQYGDDRLIVYLRLKGNQTYDSAVNALEDAGYPVVRMAFADLYDLGAQFFLWEMATAVTGRILGIQPFNQPNVEAAKVQARKMIAAYQESGSLPSSEALKPSAAALADFLEQGQPGDYIAVQAYVQPTAQTDAVLGDLRLHLRERTNLAVTVGYGPRFLHSTGQLHKGDAGNGLFVQLTASMPEDVDIPDEAGESSSGITFGTLKTAQVLGDGAALREAGRRVIHFQLGENVPAGVRALM